MDFKGFKACLNYLAVQYYSDRKDGGGRDNEEHKKRQKKELKFWKPPKLFLDLRKKNQDKISRRIKKIQKKAIKKGDIIVIPKYEVNTSKDGENKKPEIIIYMRGERIEARDSTKEGTPWKKAIVRHVYPKYSFFDVYYFDGKKNEKVS